MKNIHTNSTTSSISSSLSSQPSLTQKFAVFSLSVLLSSSIPSHINAQTQTRSETTRKILTESASRTDLYIIQKLKSFSSYKNEEGHQLISSQAIDDAERFLYGLDLNSINSPNVSAIEDGEINFWWNYPNIRIDLGMYGDNTYSFYTHFADGKELVGDNIPVSQALPDEILNALMKI